MSVAWLEAEGATVSAASGDAVVAEVPCLRTSVTCCGPRLTHPCAQVSPLVSYCGEGLQMFAGMKLKAPLLVQAECEATSQQLAGVGPVRMSKMGYVAIASPSASSVHLCTHKPWCLVVQGCHGIHGDGLNNASTLVTIALVLHRIITNNVRFSAPGGYSSHAPRSTWHNSVARCLLTSLSPQRKTRHPHPRAVSKPPSTTSFPSRVQ